MTRLALFLPALCAVLAASAPSVAQEKYASYAEARTAGAKLVRDGDLTAARGPLEAALKLSANPRDKLDAQRALLVPYRELTEVAPMQGAAEHVIAHTDQAAERSLTRAALLAFVHKRGKLADAVKGYEERLKDAPDDRTLLYLLTEAHGTYLRDHARGAELGEHLALIETNLGLEVDVPGRAILAQQYAGAQKWKEAAGVFEAIAPLDAVLAAWHYKEAASAWLKSGDKDKALAAARRSVAAAPEKRSELLTHFWHRGLGDVFLAVGEPKAAVPQYKQAIATTKIEGYQKECKAKLIEAEAATKKRD